MKRYKKSFKTKKKKPSFIKNRLLWLGIFLLLLASGSVYLFLFSAVFEVKGIEVLGSEKTSPGKIEEVIEQGLERNIFLSDLDEIVNDLLLRFPQIAEVKIKRKLPSTVLAEIIEREPVVVVKKNRLFNSLLSEELDKDYYLIDKEGVAFEKTDTIPGNIPEIIAEAKEINLGKAVIDKENIDKVLKITSGVNFKIKEIIIVSENRINMVSAEGFLVYFNPERDLDWQTEQLRILLQEKIPPEARKSVEYIDLRFEKIYINYLEQ